LAKEEIKLSLDNAINKVCLKALEGTFIAINTFLKVKSKAMIKWKALAEVLIGKDK